jgi:hybrid polyketide synthase/nonribosomal peptide synthetase ACE1
VERFDEIEEFHFTENQMILCLVELEDPIFDPFTPAKWKAMQMLTEKARNVVWVTQGGLSGSQPYGHMMTGVARCLTSEKPSMMFQLLDFDAQDVADVQSTTIAEAVLRMQVSNTWSSLVEPYTPTWTLEREVRIGLDGTVSIPRYLPNHELDARYNASRRVIRSDRVPGDEVTIVDHREVYELERVLKPEWALEDESSLQYIQVDRSLLAAVTVDSVGALFLAVGKLTGSSQPVIALSTSNSSSVSTPAIWTIGCDAGVDPSLLVTEAIHACWIEKILSVTPNNTVILVHEPPTLHFASALRDVAVDRHLTIHFTTSRRDNGNYTFIHPSRHDRALSRLLPSNLSTFVNMSGEVDLEGIAARMQKQLPSQCSVIDLSVLMAKEAFVRPSKLPEAVIPGVLARVSRYLQRSSTISEAASFDEIPVAQVAGGQIPLHQKGKVAVLNWTAGQAIPLRTYPAEDIVQFRSDKTYLLIGLAGQLGISMCDWMAQRGARHIVITSRNPKVNKAWLENIQADGVQIRVEAWFVQIPLLTQHHPFSTHPLFCSPVS